MTVEELIAALEASDFDAVVGVSEDGSIEFKGAPYRLSDSESEKYELAKDVAALAGTHRLTAIVLPVVTEPTPDSPLERAVRARPIRRGEVDEKKLRDTIAARVYPKVAGLDVRFFPSAADAENGLLAIVIPAQPEGEGPFLVRSPIGAGGDKIQGWLIGLPTRAGDQTEHVSIERLHEMLSRGGSLSTRVEEVARMLAGLADAARRADGGPLVEVETPAIREASGPDWDLVGSAAERFMTESANSYVWEGHWLPPAYALSATPTTPATVPSLFRDDGVREVIERPPITRHEGWNLATLNRAEIVQGTRLEVRSGHRKLLALHDNGVFVATAPFIDFFARERITPQGERPLYKVNSLAIIEFTYDFVRTYQAIANYLEPKPTEAQFAVAIYSATGSSAGDLFLPEHGVHSLSWTAPSDVQLPDNATYTWSFVARLEARPDDTALARAAEIAYHLIEHLYAFFKHTSSAIPYVNAERTAIDPTLFGK